MRYFSYQSFCLLLAMMCCCYIGFAFASETKDKFAYVVFASEMRDLSDPVSSAYPQLTTLLEQKRQKSPNTFFLFGGGSIGPSAMSNFDRGSHIIDILNSLEPDASGISKRDFSYFEDELSLRAQEAAYTLVGSNIKDRRTDMNLDGIADSMLISKQDITIGFISILEDRLVQQYLLEHIEVLPQRIAIVNEANKLREQGADFIIVHHFDYYDFISDLIDTKVVDFSILADTSLYDTNVAFSELHPKNLLLDRPGHALLLTLPLSENNMDMSVDLINLLSFPANMDIQEQVDEYTTRLNRLLDEQVGYWAQEVDTTRPQVRAKESIFGNFVVDTMRRFGEADIALINGGSIRGERVYAANSPITRRDLTTELPFRSRLALINVTGQQLLSALEVGVADVENLRGSFPHVSGLSFQYDNSLPKGERIIKLLINDREIELNKRYKLATTDYLAKGGDGYVPLTHGAQIGEFGSRSSILILDLVLSEVRAKGSLAGSIEQRVVDVTR